MCVKKAAEFRNTNGIQVKFSVIFSSYCLTKAYVDTTKKHKDDPSVEMIAKGRLPVQWIDDKLMMPPINCAMPRINVDV